MGRVKENVRSRERGKQKASLTQPADDDLVDSGHKQPPS